MKFLANENIPTATIKRLREAGHDVVSIGEEFPSIKDESVILFASVENRTIITFDRDYGELVFKRGIKPMAGVIYLRLQNYQPHEPAEIVLKYLISNTVFEGFFSVITDDSLRMRKI